MGYLLKVSLTVAGLALGGPVLLSPAATMADGPVPLGATPLGATPLGFEPIGEVQAEPLDEEFQAETGPVFSLRSRPKQVRAFAGRILKFKVKVKNSGDLASGPLRIRARFPKSKLSRARPGKSQISTVPAGEARFGYFAFNVKLRVSSAAHPKSVARFKVSFDLIDGGESTITTKSKVIAPPIRIGTAISKKVPVLG